MDMRAELKGLTWGVGREGYGYRWNEVLEPNRYIVADFFQYVYLYFKDCKQLKAGETTNLLKTSDMNQNESAKGDQGKGLPSAKV